MQDPATVSTDPPGRAAFAFIFVTVALDMLALGVIVPVLPKLVVQFESGNIASAAIVTGIFGTVWAAMQLIFSPILGSLSDRFGRRPVVLLSNFGLGLDYILMALAPTLGWLFVGRVISGITSSSYSTAAAYIADVSSPDRRASRYGMLGAAFGLGFVIGPAMGGLLGSVNLRLPFWVAAALSLANAAYGLMILPESLPRDRRARLAAHRILNPIQPLALLKSNPVMIGFALVAFFNYLAHESLPSVFVLYADYRYHWGEGMIGIALAAVGICSTVVSAFLIGKTVSYLGEAKALLIGLVFGVLGFAIFGLANSGFIFLLGIPVNALWGLAFPSLQALMTRQVGPEEQGRLQGAIGSVQGITGTLAPLLFTQIFAWAIAKDSQIPGIPYLLASLLVGVAFVFARRASRCIDAAEQTSPVASPARYTVED
jgi:DHA1 family tetracycline resistance protein-like MFS transporter